MVSSCSTSRCSCSSSTWRRNAARLHRPDCVAGGGGTLLAAPSLRPLPPCSAITLAYRTMCIVWPLHQGKSVSYMLQPEQGRKTYKMCNLQAGELNGCCLEAHSTAEELVLTQPPPK